MNQDALFYEDLRGAIRHLVGALGGPKVVGGLLRPTLSVKQAEAWVHDCLNPDRQAKFDLEDLSALLSEGRKRGIHCAIHQLCDESGYTRPDIAPAKTARQKLAEDYVKQAEKLKRLSDELAAIEREETVREIRSAK